MTEQQMTIRGLNVALWRRVRAEAVRRGIPAGQLLNEILTHWLEEHQGDRGGEHQHNDSC